MLNKINIRTVTIVFIFGAIAVLASHILFAVGLYDGEVDLYHNIAEDTFFLGWEKSRTVFNALKLFPTYLFLKFPVFSLNLSARVFSFGLIWIHILSFIGCYLILPKKKKHMIFFPLFAFFAGPAVSLHLSISAALSVCSYVWLIAYMIYYSDLSQKIHRTLFFILPLPLILSHELMSYMAWPLIYFCWQKNKTEENLFNKSLIGFTMIYLFIASVVQTFMTVFHEKLTNTINDKHIVINIIKYFDFLFYFYPNVNFLLAVSILIMILFLILPYKDTIKHKPKKMLIILYSLIFIFVVTASILQTMKGFIPDYNIRFYPSIITLPLGILLWWIYEKRKTDIEKISKLFLLSCTLFCLTLVFCRITFDYKFYKYQTAMATYLSKCKGVIKRSSAINHFKNISSFSHEIATNQNWSMVEVSLLYSRSRIVRSVISPSPPHLYSCPENCELEQKNELYKAYCNKLCIKQPASMFLSKLTKLHESRFFDTSEIVYYITNNISECEK